MWLGIHITTAEQPFRPIDDSLFDYVCEIHAAVISVPWVSLDSFIRDRRP
jgi:hypothetical protein